MTSNWTNYLLEHRINVDYKMIALQTKGRTAIPAMAATGRGRNRAEVEV